jgi:predicted dehydrogenase
METIDLGVIGCGYWGPNLIRNFVEIPDSRVRIVADLREDRLEAVRSRYPDITTTKDYREMFASDLDGVVIATSAATHFEIARDCLTHGLPVLVEKPLTLNSHEAGQLADLADERDLALMVGHTFEYNPAVRALKDLTESGDLGQIYYVDAVRTNLGPVRKDANALWDLASHDVSILLYILDLVPEEVSAQGGAFLSKERHDVVYVDLAFPGGILAHIHTSWLNPCKVRRVTVVGSKKMAVFDDVETLEKIRIYDKGAEVLPYTDTFADFQISYHYGDIVTPYIPFVEPLRVECHEFLECIRQHSEPRSNGRTGQRVVRVLETAERSLQNGGARETVASVGLQIHERTAV